MAPPLLSSGSQRQPRGYPMQPAAHRLAFANGAGTPGQNQKGRLENVLGILFMPEHPAANAEHHGPMAPDQLSKCIRVPPGAKSTEQVSVAGAVVVEPAQVVKHQIELRALHAL
jgi:hypothetical protein